MTALFRMLGVLAGLLLLAWPVLSQEVPADVKKAMDLVRAQVDQMGGKGAGELSLRDTSNLKQTFPDHHLIIVRFRLYPVARIIPEGLSASNIFAVSKEGKVELLKDTKTLEKFVRAHQPAVKNEKDAKRILSAWLTLSEEFHQDGMFEFEVLEKEFIVEGQDPYKVSGRTMVTQGGNGQLNAQLVYDQEGKVSQVTEKAAVRPGPRPICQATKLLDSDPIVRRMAEQDLIIMGLAARSYLMEQRSHATTELRQAIDHLWLRIEKNGW